jgi:hypothetical protein
MSQIEVMMNSYLSFFLAVPGFMLARQVLYCMSHTFSPVIILSQ